MRPSLSLVVHGPYLSGCLSLLSGTRLATLHRFRGQAAVFYQGNYKLGNNNIFVPQHSQSTIKFANKAGASLSNITTTSLINVNIL